MKNMFQSTINVDDLFIIEIKHVHIDHDIIHKLIMQKSCYFKENNLTDKESSQIKGWTGCDLRRSWKCAKVLNLRDYGSVKKYEYGYI